MSLLQRNMLQCKKERISKMRKILMIAAAMLFATAANASEQNRNLTGKQLRSALSGKTLYIQTPIGAEVPVRYRGNGTMLGRSSAQLAMLAGEDVKADKGRWWIKSTQLCQKWNNWSEGRAYCYRFQIRGNSVRWTRNDGESGSARLGN
jgi:hypothetical protein